MFSSKPFEPTPTQYSDGITEWKGCPVLVCHDLPFSMTAEETVMMIIREASAIGACRERPYSGGMAEYMVEFAKLGRQPEFCNPEALRPRIIQTLLVQGKGRSVALALERHEGVSSEARGVVNDLAGNRVELSLGSIHLSERVILKRDPLPLKMKKIREVNLIAA